MAGWYRPKCRFANRASLRYLRRRQQIGPDEESNSWQRRFVSILLGVEARMSLCRRLSVPRHLAARDHVANAAQLSARHRFAADFHDFVSGRRRGAIHLSARHAGRRLDFVGLRLRCLGRRVVQHSGSDGADGTPARHATLELGLRRRCAAAHQATGTARADRRSEPDGLRRRHVGRAVHRDRYCDRRRGTFRSRTGNVGRR